MELETKLILEEISIDQLKLEAWEKNNREFLAYLNGCEFMVIRMKKLLKDL